MLTPVSRLLYLSCLLVAGESTSSQIEVSHESLVFQSGVKSGSLESQLELLQSFQLLTYEKMTSLINRIEKNRREENRKEVARSCQNDKKSTESTEQNKQIWEAYLNAYLKRYSVPPLRNAMVNKQVSNLRERVGYENAIKLVEFFLSHNESFYLKKTHAIGLCLQDCESLMTQMKRNQPITQAKVKMFEKQQTKIENDILIENLWSDENVNS